MGAMGFGVGMGLLSAAGSLAGSAEKNQQYKYRQQQAERQAQAAKIEGQIKAEQIDRERHKMSQDYRSRQAANNVSLGLGNVDASSGSAMRVAEGNADMFNADLDQNSYQRALNSWETNEKMKQAEWQADYFSNARNNTAGTLLGAGLAGLSGFMSGYSMAGGKFFGEAAAKGKYWDRALQQWVEEPVRH